MDEAQRALIETMAAGAPYLDLHVDMHRRLADILSETGLISCSAEEAFESGLTETFLPHGLGHLIGLQTHDVGGQQAGTGRRPDAAAGKLPGPAADPNAGGAHAGHHRARPLLHSAAA